MEPIYYASGTNKPGEIRGMARAGNDYGVAAHECLTRGCEAALVRAAKEHPDRRLFIDNGAFSEVKAKGGKLEVVRPITEEEWSRRLALMERVGRAYGNRLLIMAPDRIADQQETLRRLRWFKESGWLGRMFRTGAEIAVVLQGGELDPVAFDRAAAKALGWDGYAVAFPMMKGATPLPLVVDFLRRRPAKRVHLLGIGPKARGGKGKPSAAEIRRQLFQAFPAIRWSWDSCLICASVGRDDPRIRVYTTAQDLERQALHAEALTGGVRFQRGAFVYDFTDMQSRPSLYLLDLWGAPALNKCVAELQAKPRRADTAAGRRAWRRLKARWDRCRADFREKAMATATDAGLSAEAAEAFIADPDAFAAKGNRLVHDRRFAVALERAFDQWTRTSARKGGPPEIADLLAERATYRAFRPGGLELEDDGARAGQQVLRGFE